MMSTRREPEGKLKYLWRQLWFFFLRFCFTSPIGNLNEIFYVGEHFDKLNEGEKWKLLGMMEQKKSFPKRNFLITMTSKFLFMKARIAFVDGNGNEKEKSYRLWKWMQIFHLWLISWLPSLFFWHRVASLSPIKASAKMLFISGTRSDKM